MRVKLGLVVAICLVALSAHSQLSNPVAGDASLAPGVLRAPDSQRDIENSGSISGTVTTIDGAPLRDCRVELLDARRGNTIAHTTAGVSGGFDFQNVPSGTYEVVATSGINQAHERIDVSHSQVTVDMRLSVQSSDTPGSGATVSISELKIPEKARKEWAKGQQAFFKNKLQEARKHADRALEIAPQYAQALTLRGILKLGDEETEAGVADLQQAVKQDANYAMGYFALGAGLNVQRKFDEAARTLERGLSLDPKAWQGWFELTKSELARGNFKEALKNITRAQELNNSYPGIHLLMAHALLGNHHYSRSVEEFELYLSQEPNSPNATNARAGLSEARSYMQAAEK